MDTHLRHAVEQIHSSSAKAVLYVTGGAATALTWLLTIPGASNTVLEGLVPYSRSSFTSTLPASIAATITSNASLAAARGLAATAYRRAVTLADPGNLVVGVAAACALETVPPNRTLSRACIAAHSADRVVEYQIDFSRDNASRQKQDILASRLFLQALYDATICTKKATNCSPTPISLSQESSLFLIRDHISRGDVLHPIVVNEFTDPIRAVLSGDAQYAERLHGVWNRNANRSDLIFPGSFNPLHDGHTQLLATAHSKYSAAVPAFEISVTNPDKAPIDEETLLKRLSQIPDQFGVIVSRAPLFSLKADLYGKVQFVVGIDTAIRILSPKYYDAGGLTTALVELKTKGCSFIVGGRLEQRKDGTKSDRFLTLNDAEIPVGFESMFEQIDPRNFRVDLSSSEIRGREK